uniref:TOPBP1 interacting checkpoint and replication regulator n=1 Tax=Cyanistes caeruleus TaxID=156563 RepID=A0A8C0UT41_CYACU
MERCRWAGRRGPLAALEEPARVLAGQDRAGVAARPRDPARPWDRPEIASPAKPPRRSRRTGLAAQEPPEAPPEGFVNAVFLFSPCPHSRRELRQFVSGNDAPSSPGEPPTAQELAEKLLPKSVQELLVEQKITLFWVDTADWAQLIECPDHGGYWTMFEVICQMGGTILPAEALVHPRADAAPGFPVPQDVPWARLLPLDATLNCLFSRPSLYRSVFPQQEGTLFFSMPGKKQESCTVILEPLAMSQRHLQCPVSIFLKGSLTGWSLAQAGHFLTESWILQSLQAGQGECNRSLFHQLLRTLVAEGLHMIAEVSLSKTWCPCTAVLSPLSEDAAVLTVLGPEKTAEIQGCSLEGAVVEDSSQNCPTHLFSNFCVCVYLTEEEAPVPEWVQRELSHTAGWHPSVLEAWYPASNACGASSDLMESFRADADQCNVELSESLSELYQRKFNETSAAAGPGNNKKRRGVPRTPVRQKMKTMPRSLQMLNVARLNVKAQKFQPDAVPPAVNEKVPQKPSAKRLDEKVEGKAKEIFIITSSSHLAASYQKAVAEGIPSSVCAQNMIVAIKRFLKIQGVKEKEMACVGTVRNHLLKTSKMLRQQHGSQKETKVRECRLQVFLRLELCLQCPSLQSNAEEMEQLLEEVTDMLRILCLTEDPAYLTKFLEEILELYMNSIPKILGDIYYGLGTQIPPKLASVLPSDFFSDDSMTLDSKSPGLPPSLSSVLTPSAVCTESDQLEELRTRSAKKRRKNVLARHRSMTEAPQNLRQIEIPKVAKNPIRKVTKVRRNLFNEEILSPSKRSLKKMLRSQSVSAVEGLKYKCTSGDHRKLLTKRVSETPLHKQVSRRLLHKQIKGRSSDPGCDTGVVEESPEKAIYEAGLRRSPRIKQLSLNRTCSGAFYSTAQPSSKNSQHLHQGQEKESCKLQDVEGTKWDLNRLILLIYKAGMDSSEKIPHKFSQKPLNSASKVPRRSPRIVHRTPQKLEKTPGKSSAAKQPVAKCLGKYFSHPAQRVKSPSALSDSKSVHLLPVTAEDCCAALTLSPPFKEPGLQTPKHERFRGLNASVLPPTDSNPAASYSPSATQESCLTELQTPRRSSRYLSKLASPVSARRQILTKEIQVQLDQVSQACKRTPSKLEDPGSKLCTSPLSTEIPQLAARPEPLCSSPLHESSTNTVTSCSASHTQAGDSDWEPGASTPSSQKISGITGTSLKDCEPSLKGENCSANTCESFLSDLQTVSDDLEARTPLREEYMGLKAPNLKKRSRFSLNTSPPLQKSPPAYSLRCTADRRQREAAARMGEPHHHKLPSASSPTYEVEIEMQASGLPKLRIKKIGSCSSLEVQPEASASKPRGGESSFSDFAMTWCSKHPGKLAAACVSPSCCRSFHSTPGKGAGQTYICQSYTPTSCASTVTSPFPLEAGVLQTPSPKQKGKATPDAINDWPRRKRAAGSTANGSCGQSERNADDQTRVSAGRERAMRISEHYSSKVTNTLGEFELEGICRLQDQASPSDSEPRADEDSAMGTFGLKSQKRVFTCLSPEKEENHSAKRSHADRGSLDLNGMKVTQESSYVGSATSSSCLHMVFGFLESPVNSGRLWLSCILSVFVEEESDAAQITASQELSPFRVMASRRHRFSRTYSRKNLLS